MMKEWSNVKHFSFEYCIPAKQEYEKVYEDKLLTETDVISCSTKKAFLKTSDIS